MSTQLNNIILQGNLCRDPEIFYTREGKGILNFALANNQKYGEKNQELFIDCVVFGKLAETMQRLLHKGKNVTVIGKLKQESWIDQASNQKRTKFKITAKEIFLGSGSKYAQQGQGNQYNNNQAPQYNNYQSPNPPTNHVYRAGQSTAPSNNYVPEHSQPDPWSNA